MVKPTFPRMTECWTEGRISTAAVSLHVWTPSLGWGLQGGMFLRERRLTAIAQPTLAE